MTRSTFIPDRSNCDTREIRKTLQLIMQRDAVIEIRALGAQRCGTVSGYFDYAHLEAAVEACAEYSGQAEGVYVTINPVTEQVHARSANSMTRFAKHTTRDTEVTQRCWLPIDFDPKRPSGISSTEPEHATALQRAHEADQWLQFQGFSEDSIVVGDSGNGAHVLVRIELECNDSNISLVKTCLGAIANRFGDGQVDVDQTVHNPARIWKVYGTVAAKGSHTPDRPHRLALLQLEPNPLVPATQALLEKLANTLPKAAQDVLPQCRLGRASGRTDFDIDAWISRHDIPVVQEKPWNGGRLLVLNPCPWNSDHDNRSAYIIKHANGALAAGCHHNGCSGKSWHDLRDLLEPGWRDQRSGGTQLVFPPNAPLVIQREFRRATQQRRR